MLSKFCNHQTARVINYLIFHSENSSLILYSMYNFWMGHKNYPQEYVCHTTARRKVDFTSLDFYFSGLHDGDAKEKVFLQLLHDLPNENYYCIVAIVEHLVRYLKPVQ